MSRNTRWGRRGFLGLLAGSAGALWLWLHRPGTGRKGRPRVRTRPLRPEDITPGDRWAG